MPDHTAILAVGLEPYLSQQHTDRHRGSASSYSALTDGCYDTITKTRSYIAVCFSSGVIGALAVVIFSVVLYHTGISALMGVNAPPKLKSPDIYRPLFWGGLWGIPFGLMTWKRESHYYLIGWLYFLAPVLALYFIFLPTGGLGVFGLTKGLPFTFYLLLVNAPFGIVTAVLARWLSPSAMPS